MRSPDLSLPAWDKMPDWNQDLARKGSQWWNTFGLGKWLNQSLESWITWEQELKLWKHQHSMPIPQSELKFNQFVHSGQDSNFCSLKEASLLSPPTDAYNVRWEAAFVETISGRWPCPVSIEWICQRPVALMPHASLTSSEKPKAGLLWRGWRLAGVTHPCDLAMWRKCYQCWNPCQGFWQIPVG